MAIKIPSKHIYSMDNPKIRDNFIDNVEVNMTVVTPSNEFETPVHNESFSNYVINAQQNTDIKVASETITSTVSYIQYNSAFAYTYVAPYYTEVSIKIPVVSKNKWIEKIIVGTNDDGENNIKYSLYGKSTIYSAKGTLKSDNGDFSGLYWLSLPTRQDLISESDIHYELPKSPYENIEKTGIGDLYIADATLTLNDKSNLSTANVRVETINNIEYYILDLVILSGLELCRVKATKTHIRYYTKAEPLEVDLTGQIENFTPLQIEVTLYGNTIGISLEDGTITYGTGNKPFSLDGNELLQDSATTNGKLTTQHLAENILAQYQNGKETATLLCDIGEYYEEDGTKKIGIEMQDRMSFHEHDLVIPYVFGADGKDRPMSRYSNGEPKIFEVVSVKRFFDGAVWQELSLLEFTKTT